MKKDTYEETYEKAIRYLGERARTQQQIEKYLLSKEFSQENIDKTIIRLVDFGYVDDVDFGKAYITYSIGKRRGPSRITRELREKGVSSFDIEDANFLYLEENQLEEEDLEEIFLKNAIYEAEKIHPLGKIEQKLLGRISRRLVTLGYDKGTIYKVVGKYMQGGELIE